jgi:pimeloyl-ACP methyl ester carboxylesterase
MDIGEGLGLESLWATVEGRPMHARVCVHKSGAATSNVVLVHGLGVSSRYMVPTAERLMPYGSVYAPDLPGFGKSAKPPHVLNVPQMADALDEWMGAIGLRSASFIGNSMGCQVIVDLAIRYPQRVQRAVLTSPTFDRKSRASFPLLLWRLAKDVPWEPLSLTPIVLTDFLSAGLIGIARTLRYGLLDPIEEKLPLLTVPTLVVRGEHDAVAPLDWVKLVADLIPSARYVVVRGACHAINYSCPGKLAKIVLPFFGYKPNHETADVIKISVASQIGPFSRIKSN